MARKPMDRTVLFMKRVNKESESGCWIWTGYPLWRTKYGSHKVDGKTYASHRYAWMLFRGDIPERMHVCHTCDNPRCVNPDHLWLGTHAENMIDKKNKGRAVSARGTGKKCAKLNEEKVREIIRLGKAGVPRRSIAQTYGVTLAHIGDIINRKLWTHLDVNE